MNLLTPCPDLIPGMMEQSEIEALDVLVHLLAPDLVLEIGRAQGHTARVFARHARVLSLDLLPPAPRWLLPDQNVVQLVGRSPGDLHLFLQEPWFTDPRVHRRVAFLDGDHYADCVVPETEFMFRHGAVAVLGHDPGFVGYAPGQEERGTMPEALDRLQKRGRRVLRVMDCGRPFSATASTGFWLCWPA